MAKTTLALLLLLLVVVSVAPATLADRGSDDGTDDDSVDNEDHDAIELESETQSGDDDSDGRLEVRERTRIKDGEIREELRTRVGNIRERIETRLDERRDRVETRIEDRRARIDDRKERVEARIEQFREHRDQLIDVKARITANCADEGSDECVAVRAEFSTTAQEFLLGAASKVQEHLDRMEQYVLDHVDDADLQAELLAEIDGLSVRVEVVISEVEDLGDAATRDDLAAARDEIKDVWQQARDLTKKLHQRLVMHKVHAGAEKLVNLEERLTNIAGELEGNGADTTELNRLIGEFSAELEAAANAETAEDARAHFSAAVPYVRQILQEINDLRKGLRGEARADVRAEREDRREQRDDGTVDDGSNDGSGETENESDNDGDESNETEAQAEVDVGVESDDGVDVGANVGVTA